MNAKRCDRCGEYFDYKPCGEDFIIQIGDEFRKMRIELCNKCITKITDFIENGDYAKAKAAEKARRKTK